MENIRNLKNSSLNGEDILLIKGRSYFVIDVLYINDIKNKIDKLDSRDLAAEIRNKVFGFPRTDTPFTTLAIPGNDGVIKFSPFEIIKGQPSDDKQQLFATDTGIVIFIDESIMLDVVKHLDYNVLVDSITEPINRAYWHSVSEKYKENQLGLILAPGVNTGYEFDGSGLYKIKTY